MSNNYNTPSSLGIDPRLAGVLAYLPVVDIVFFFVEKENRYVKFHAAQGMLISAAMLILSIAAEILGIVPFLGWIVRVLCNLACGVGGLILIIIGMIKAWACEWYRFPIIGDMAMQLSEKVG